MRASYQTLIWKCANVNKPVLPSPVGMGWIQDKECCLYKDSTLKVHWTTGDVMPPQLIDILHDSTTNKHTETGSAVADEDFEEDDVIDSILDVIFEDDGTCVNDD